MPDAKTCISLQEISLFESVADSTLSDIRSCTTQKSYLAGEEIISYFASGNEVFFVLAGKCRVNIYAITGKAVAFREVRPGGFFGEYAALDGGTRSASVEAIEDSVVASMSSADFQRIIKSDANIAEALVFHLVAQVRALTVRVYEFSTLAVNNRIQAELLRLASDHSANASECTNTALLNPAPKHSDLASRISTHREAVTRHLSDLTRMGIIERQGRALLVKDVERLGRMVVEATGE